MKKNKRVLQGSIPFIIGLLILVVIFSNTSMYNGRSTVLKVKKGELTIPRNSEKKVFFLEGEFHFTPNRFNCIKNPDKQLYATLPASLQESPLACKTGYACYGLHIEGLNPSIIYSLDIPQAFSSASIFVDGEESGKQGVLSKNEEEEEPGISSSATVFKSKRDGSADIVLNISNFTQEQSGFLSRLMLGEVNAMNKLFRSDLIFSTAIFATILTVSTFLILLFFFYTQARFVVWFAFASIALAIRGVVFYPHLASFIFQDITWHVLFIVRYLSFPFAIIFFTLFIKQALKTYWKIPYILVLTISGIYVLSILFLPPKISGNIPKYYQVASVFCILYNVNVLFVALIKKREYALWVFIAIMVLAMLGCYDLLVTASYIKGAYFTPVASLISIVILSIMILKMYSTSIEKVEELRFKSKEINASLSRFVPQQIVSLLGKKSIKDIKIGEHIEATMPVLSADIRSFTNMAERLSSQGVFDYLNSYFALIVPIIRKHNGIIPKYLGDGFFALFPDGSSSALQCAIEIQTILAKHPIIVAGDGLKVGIGIDSGRVLFGTIGNAERMDVIIISNAYKNSEMLQWSTKKYGSAIIISSSVFSSLEAGEKLFVRPVQLVRTAHEKQSFLYEVYACDAEEIKLLKNRTQAYLVDAFDAICKGNARLALSKFSQVLNIFPQDIIAREYLNMLQAKIK